MANYITWRDIKSYSKFVELSEAVRRDRDIVANPEKQRAILKALDQWEANYRRDNPLPGQVSKKDIYDHGRELFPQGKGGGSSNVDVKSGGSPHEGIGDTDIESAFIKDL